jgi:hypothetical protein
VTTVTALQSNAGWSLEDAVRDLRGIVAPFLDFCCSDVIRAARAEPCDATHAHLRMSTAAFADRPRAWGSGSGVKSAPSSTMQSSSQSDNLVDLARASVARFANRALVGERRKGA